MMMMQSVPGDLLRLLVAHNELLVPLFFVLFFVGAFAAAFCYRRRFVREGYVAVFFVCLLLVSLTPGGYLIRPMEDLHKFSPVAPDEKVNYLMYVEDSAGQELRFDRRVIPTVSPGSSVSRALATRCTPDEGEAAGRYLLLQARDYRERVESSSVDVAGAVDFPRHQRDHQWTRERLSPYGPFVTLNVYEVRLRYTADGLAVASETRTKVFEATLDPAETHVAYPPEEACG